MESEKFCLRWNNFETNISSAFRYLRDDNDFFDVTLVCEDEQIQAHKVILSACSPFFHKILRRNPHQHPLLYMKGVKCQDMKSLLDFMYHGEVNVAQEELNSFLAVAEDLSVKGLTQNKPQESSLKDTNFAATKHPENVAVKMKSNSSSQKQHPSHVQPSYASSAHHQEDEEVQQVLSIKTEPIESKATSSKVALHFDQPMAMYQEEEEVQEYGESEVEQVYLEGNISTLNRLSGAAGILNIIWSIFDMHSIYIRI